MQFTGIPGGKIKIRVYGLNRPHPAYLDEERLELRIIQKEAKANAPTR